MSSVLGNHVIKRLPANIMADMIIKILTYKVGCQLLYLATTILGNKLRHIPQYTTTPNCFQFSHKKTSKEAVKPSIYAMQGNSTLLNMHMKKQID